MEFFMKFDCATLSQPGFLLLGWSRPWKKKVDNWGRTVYYPNNQYDKLV
jgi:hypothetical protein